MPKDYNDDADYPLPPDSLMDSDPVAEADTLVVPPPAAVTTMAVPRARYALKVQTDTIKHALAQLKKIELGEQEELGAVAIEALICGATLTRYPANDKLPHVKRLRERAQNGDLDQHHPFALDELEDALGVVEAALVALKAISALDEPIPGQWSNLHPLELARKINGLGYTLLRGRIAGMSL